jgi:uncharacterized protein (TIGR01619 family)
MCSIQKCTCINTTVITIFFMLILSGCKGQDLKSQLPIPSDEIKNKNKLNNDPNAYWDTYVAEYENGPGSVTLNMDLIDQAPLSKFPFVLVTGVTFNNCGADGFPTEPEFDSLYGVSDTITDLLSCSIEMVYAGTFTHECQRLNYIYVTDTIGLRSLLTQKYKTRFKNYIPYINIKEDKKWEAYLEFLYPNETIMEYMKNEKVTLNLLNNGDNLKTPRQVDHFIYFANAKDRENFIKSIRPMGFKIENKETFQEMTLPFKLQISRSDKVDVSSITQVTLELSNMAKENNGKYDGWETFVVKQ